MSNDTKYTRWTLTDRLKMQINKLKIRSASLSKLSGHKSYLSNSVHSAKRKLDDLEKSLESVRNSIDRCEIDHDLLIDSIRQFVADLKSKYEDETDDEIKFLLSFNSTYQEYARQLTDVKSKISAFEIEAERIAAQYHVLRTNYHSMKNAIDIKSEEINILQSEMQSIKTEIRELNFSIGMLNTKYEITDIRVSSTVSSIKMTLVTDFTQYYKKW